MCVAGPASPLHPWSPARTSACVHMAAFLPLAHHRDARDRETTASSWLRVSWLVFYTHPSLQALEEHEVANRGTRNVEDGQTQHSLGSKSSGETPCYLQGETHLSHRFSLKHHWGRKENSLGRHGGESFQHRQDLRFPTQLYSNKVLTQEQKQAGAYTSQYLGFT